MCEIKNQRQCSLVIRMFNLYPLALEGQHLRCEGFCTHKISKLHPLLLSCSDCRSRAIHPTLVGLCLIFCWFSNFCVDLWINAEMFDEILFSEVIVLFGFLSRELIKSDVILDGTVLFLTLSSWN